MLCYSLIEKRGDCIKKLINWKLISNNEEVVNNEFVECEFENNILKYNEDNTLNIIDLNNQSYERKNEDFTFAIDFKNRCFNYILIKDNLSIENAKLDGEMEYENNIITLKYNLGEEEKKIIIQIL